MIEIIRKTALKTRTDACLVGGYVRDKILAIETKDVDVVVVGSVRPFVEALQDALGCDCICHEKFGTYVFELEDETRLDVATSRKEIYLRPAALPKVTLGCPLKDDLGRRDFTINAMAMKLDAGHGTQDAAGLIDCYGGLEDLNKGVIRVLHEKSFQDDPTRIIRAARFSVRFGFKLERVTERLIDEAIKTGVISALMPSRIGKEFLLMLKETDTYRALCFLKEIRVLNLFFEELNFDKIEPFGAGEVSEKLKKITRATEDPVAFMNKYHLPRSLKKAVRG